MIEADSMPVTCQHLAQGVEPTIFSDIYQEDIHIAIWQRELSASLQDSVTEWLPHEVVNRTKLGEGADGQADHQSGLYPHQHDIQQLNCGDVALLKGMLWQGNENAGLVHRSPKLANKGNRLLLTLDFID